VDALNAIQASVEADRIQTGLDAEATSADRHAVADIFDHFDDRYLGPYATDPTLDNDGDPLVGGQVYWNTDSHSLRFYNGATWEDPTAQAATSATNAHNSELAAAASETSADEDATQTALDRIATAADRVQTVADVVATGADRVQTGLDAAATAADRIQTGLDVITAEFASTTAETQKDRAQEWAEKEEDSEVVTGKYSADPCR